VPEAERAPRVIDADLDYLITSMMHEVVVRGTGAAVRSLGRDDLAGKTGTTNDFTDAWFNGFNTSLVAISWIGFDQPTSLGHGEVGARAALPVWMDFMKIALKDVPQQILPRPPGVVEVPIDPANGKLLPVGAPGSIMEVVQADHIPPPDDGSATPGAPQASADIY
jgi:penicillin-binding protein 1A